jgi:hypothetical protein
MDPVVVGCRPVIPGVSAIQSGASAYWPVVAVATLTWWGQHLREVLIALAFVGGSVSGIGRDVSLIGGSQNLVGLFHASGEGGFAGRYIGLATLKLGLASIEVRLVWSGSSGHGGSEPPTRRHFERWAS